MRKYGKYVFLLLFAVALLIPCFAEAARGINVRPISPSGAEVTGDQWLFVIGIDTYIDWPRLKTAVSDAKSLRDVLLSRYHFDKDHLIEIYDEEATRDNIIGKLRFLAKNLHQEDSLFIFYAGHGHLDSITKEGSWIPMESDMENASAWITNHDIKNYLRVDAIKAKHILLISDSCFSGDFFRGHRGKPPKVTNEVVKRAYKLTSRQAITSGGLEPVADEGFGSNSVFSHFLVKTLKENQRPFLVPSDFFPDIKAGVAENADQFPQFGSLKDTGGQQGGEIVLFLKQDSRLKDLSAEAAEREKELERLRRMEDAAEEARKTEAEEIAKREKELSELDAKIIAMRKRLNTPDARSSDSLDAMLAMVRQKEEQQRRLEELKKKRQQEEAERRAEIERLKEEKRAKVIAGVKEDIRKYEQIVSSPFGKDMKADAWNGLAAKYPEAAEGLDSGDTQTLLAGVLYGAQAIKSDGRVIAFDERFVAYDNGTVKDTRTGLMWAAKDNGKDINWQDAKRYCESYHGGGYTDWRMPTQDELARIYDKNKKNRHGRHVTKLVDIGTDYLWASEARGPEVAFFNFFDGNRYWYNQSFSSRFRALPVRGGK
ncbi:MAG: caspase family protein [Desulfobacterales bacterium]|nr:caspase family protein [Desulfobacterales bacterium]